MKNQMKAVWCILAMTTIWLTMNSSKINTHASEQKDINNVVQSMVYELEKEKQSRQVEEELTFKEVFKEMRAEHGSNYVFDWEGEYYTTDYAEEVSVYINSVVGGWVQNSNDLDDFCATNDRDDCGVCGGQGARDWYVDRDGDGLGDPKTYKISCEQPTALNE